MIRTIALVVLITVASISPAMAGSGEGSCDFVKVGSDEIRNDSCHVTVEGSLDSKYDGKQTYVPGKMDILWSDGLKTSIVFEGLISVGSPRSGIALLDGKGHQFSISAGSGLTTYKFNRLDSNLNNKTIVVTIPNHLRK
jgi:hypothetical protein